MTPQDHLTSKCKLAVISEIVTDRLKQGDFSTPTGLMHIILQYWGKQRIS